MRCFHEVGVGVGEDREADISFGSYVYAFALLVSEGKFAKTFTTSGALRLDIALCKVGCVG